MIQFLEWDSSFFGLKIGKYHSASPDVAELQNLCQSKATEGYDLVYLFVDQINTTASNWLQDKGLAPVDEKVIYEKKIINRPFTPAGVTEYCGECTPDLVNLALASGHKSRFKIDERLNHKFADFYKLWMSNSLNGSMADTVFVVREGDAILGFVTIKQKNDIGQIGLIAVDENARGRGIGRQLIQACDCWLYDRNVLTHQVVTQKQNTGACALYEKTGFFVKEVQIIYHF